MSTADATVDGRDLTADGAILDAATNANTASTIVKRDGSGDFAAGKVTGNLVGDVYASNGTSSILDSGTDGSDATFTGDVTGDLTGTVTATGTLADGVEAHTQDAGDDSSKVATTAFVRTEIGELSTELEAEIDTKQDTITAGTGLSFTGATLNAETGGHLKAVRSAYANSHTHVGADDRDDIVDILTFPNVTLSASTTYVLEWHANLHEDDGGAAENMDGEIQYSTDGASYTKIIDIKANEQTAGSSGTSEQHAHDLSFLIYFTTNSSGGTYYFRFDCNQGTDSGAWGVHDIHCKISECSDVSGLLGLVQS